MQGMKTDAPLCQHLFHGFAQGWPGNRHGLRFGAKKMYFSFLSQATFAKRICDEHSAFVRRAGAFIGQRAYHHSHGSTAEALQSVAQLCRAVESVKGVRTLHQAGDGLRGQFRPKSDDEVIIMQHLRARMHSVVSNVNGLSLGQE